MDLVYAAAAGSPAALNLRLLRLQGLQCNGPDCTLGQNAACRCVTVALFSIIVRELLPIHTVGVALGLRH